MSRRTGGVGHTIAGIAIVAVLLFSGCGYHFASSGDALSSCECERNTWKR